MDPNAALATDAWEALRAVLGEFGHDDVDDVSVLDGLDMIAAVGEGWVAILASRLYYREIVRLSGGNTPP